ncbi:MAG: MBL fold metallo-hydrolase [Rhodocyclales bacterium]|nr:MBL fold metallo-hydrolase [Rhodocyclales bacterium]
MLPDFPYRTPPAPGETIEVAPGIHWLRMPLPFALDHINLWLLEDTHDGQPSWTIVDTGYGLDNVRALWEQILGRLTAPVRRIIVTHFHPDHVGLAQWLQEKSGAPVWMTATEYLTAHAVFHESSGHGTQPMLRQFERHGLDAGRIAELEKRSNGYARGVPALPHAYFRMFDGDRFPINGKSWQVRVGYGHSPEHASLYCAEAGVLISGDMLLPKISTNISVFAVTPGADSLAQYLDSLNRYRELPEETLVLPSHGLPFIGIHNRVAAQHAHHEERLRVLEDACIEPRSAADLLATLFPRELDTHQVMFAMGEAIAHLNRLEYAGKLVRREGQDGVIRYQRTN